ISIVRSLFAYVERSYSKEELLELANIAETYAHGSPSGIDTLTISSKCPIWYEKEKPFDYLTLGEDLHFIVADSGRVVDTKKSLESVTNLFKKAPRKIQRKIERI